MHILNLATRWVRVVGFTPLQLHFQPKGTLFPLSGFQSQSTCFGKVENILALLAINQDYIYEKTLATEYITMVCTMTFISCNFPSAVKVVEMKCVYDRIDKKH